MYSTSKMLIACLFIVFISKLQAQNVGIGTTTPTTDLEIAKSPIVKFKLKSNNYTDTSQIIFSNKVGTSNTGTDIIMSSNQEAGLRFSSKSDVLSRNKSNIIEIKPTGKIGMATSSPEGQFQINHRATVTNPTFTILDSSTMNIGGGIFRFRNVAGVNKFDIKGSIGTLADGTDSYLDFFMNSNTIMNLKGDGLVGIGSIEPSKGGLTVNKKVGNVHAIYGDNTYGVAIESNFPGIHFNSYYNTSRKTMVTGYTGGFEMEPALGTLRFYTSPASTTAGNTASIFSRLSITREGNVGVNITNPTDKLEVEGNIALRGSNLFEFGKGVVGKEINAGKVGYNAFGQNGVVFVGGGTSTLNRRFFFYNEGGAAFSGNIEALTSITVGTTTLPSGYRVSVDGKIIAEELRIQNSTAWPDYVFEKDYDLMPLKDVEKNIVQNKHLPNVPSASEVAKEGIIVGEMQKVLLRKIEELTLYIIEQDKRIKELENKMK